MRSVADIRNSAAAVVVVVVVVTEAARPAVVCSKAADAVVVPVAVVWGSELGMVVDIVVVAVVEVVAVAEVAVAVEAAAGCKVAAEEEVDIGWRSLVGERRLGATVATAVVAYNKNLMSLAEGLQWEFGLTVALAIGTEGIAGRVDGLGIGSASNRTCHHSGEGLVNSLQYSKFVGEDRTVEGAAGSLDLRTCLMALVLFLDGYRATVEDNCCIVSAAGHHIHPIVDQNSCCNNFRHRLDYSLARMVFEDTYWLQIVVPGDHNLPGYVGCMY